MRGKALQHAAETRALGVRERAEHVLFDFLQTLLGLSAPLLPLPGGHDVPAAAIQRIGAPLHQAGFLEIVDQIGHHRAIDAQSLRQRTLAAGLVLHRRDQHLVAARSAGDVAHHGMRRIEVRTEITPNADDRTNHHQDVRHELVPGLQTRQEVLWRAPCCL